MFGLDKFIVDTVQLYAVLGYFVYFAIIFAESGLFFGFFLPGDSLIFTLALLCSQGLLNVWAIVIIGSIAAITGDSVGYLFGRKVGAKLFEKEDNTFFKKEHLIKAQNFYEKYGTKTIVLARFTPIVRTFAPIVAGAAKMHYSTFITYNTVGGISWICSMTALGYYLGRSIPNIDKYILPIIAVIVILSVIPALSQLIKKKK